VSRYYNMRVEVNQPNPKKLNAIKKGLDDFWEFPAGEWNDYGETNEWSVSMDGYLLAGDTEEKFCAELADRVWQENGAWCEVIVHATYLENVPSDTYTFDKDDYKERQEKVVDSDQG